MIQSHRLLRTVRSLHLYFGVFMAPALLFFAVTGGLQSFGLHESERGSTYRPPAWLVSLSHLHKKQSLSSPQRRRLPPRPEAAAPESGRPGPEAGQPPREAKPVPQAMPESRAQAAQTPPPRRRNLLPMKIFFGLVAVGLIGSTLGGLYMAFRFKRDAKVVGGVFLAGIIVPLLLLLF